MQGENAPPMHPRCRCTITAVLGDYGKRSAKVKGRREKIPLSIDYASWKEKYLEGSPKFLRFSYETKAKTLSLREFQEMAQELKPLAEKYSGRESLWSGKIRIADGSAKDWTCDIFLERDAPKHVLLHELIHSCSCSHYLPEVFLIHRYEEELTVQLLCQEVSRLEGIEIIAGGYDRGVELLRKIKQSINTDVSDLEFAQNLIKQPLNLRWEYLESLTSNVATVEEYLKSLKQIEVLRKWRVRQRKS